MPVLYFPYFAFMMIAMGTVVFYTIHFDNARSRKIIWTVMGVGPRAIDAFRTIHRNVDDPWIHGTNINGWARHNDSLLRHRCERARRKGHLPKVLDGIINVDLLRHIGVAKLLRPIDVFVHYLQHLGRRDQRLDAGVPILNRRFVNQLLRGSSGSLLHPAISFDNIQRHCGRPEDIVDQRIGVQRDRCQQLLKLLLGI